MNRDYPEENVPYWGGLKASLMSLGFYKVRRGVKEMVIYEPVCKSLSYVPEFGRVVASLSRSQFPAGLCIDDLKLSKAQAVFRAYVGRNVLVVVTNSDVYFGIPTVMEKAREVARA